MLLRSARVLAQGDLHEMPLLAQPRHDEWMHEYLCTLLAHDLQFLGGMRSLHGQESAAGSQQVAATMHHIRKEAKALDNTVSNGSATRKASTRA